ncbi:MAG: penicillin-binding Tp47 domain C-containing protein [Collinsella sp.]
MTNNNGTFSFSAAATGTDSGIEGQELKTATGIEPTVKDASGSYGEFLRVDLNGNYGDLGANMQSVTWTYYGDDATYTNALATYGTKFAADNWMHKSMGIQLGLTKSERCQLPEGTNGTGYWKLTVHALGYNDYTYTFQATDDNIVGAKEPVTDATKAQLQELYDKATSLDKSKYTENSWTASFIETETAETKDLLAKKNLGEAEAAEQITHLQGALDALVSLYPQAGDYVLMNIPYADFYAAENNNAGTDIVTSATLQKTRSSLASGSYHVNSDGRDISGVTFAVKVGKGDIDWSKFTRVTDDSSVTITTSIKGKVSTTTYKGKDALFESADYSYYVLPAGEGPTNYKELTSDSEGNLRFGAVEGKEATKLENVTPDFKTSSKYATTRLTLRTCASRWSTPTATRRPYTVPWSTPPMRTHRRGLWHAHRREHLEGQGDCLELRPGQRVSRQPVELAVLQVHDGQDHQGVTFYTLRAPTPLPWTSNPVRLQVRDQRRGERRSRRQDRQDRGNVPEGLQGRLYRRWQRCRRHRWQLLHREPQARQA